MTQMRNLPGKFVLATGLLFLMQTGAGAPFLDTTNSGPSARIDAVSDSRRAQAQGLEGMIEVSPIADLAGTTPTLGAIPVTLQFSCQTSGGTLAFDTTDGTAGAISAQGANPPIDTKAAAFDKNNSTKWLDFAKSSPATRASWIQYQYPGGSKRVVSHYSITSANDAPERDPMKWRLRASNNGTNFVTLDTRTNEAFGERFQKLDYALSNSTPYNIYRLQIDSVLNPASATCVQLAEIELFENPVYTYSWSFGDGAVSTLPCPRHTFAKDGTYSVRVVVSDGATSLTNTATVMIDPGFVRVMRAAGTLAFPRSQQASGPRKALSQLEDFPIVISAFRADSLTNAIVQTSVVGMPTEYSTNSPWKAVANEIRIPSGTRRAEFSLVSKTVGNHKPIRYRYQLEGYENEWHDVNGTMRVVAFCRDQFGQPVDSAEFVASDNSPGWTGDPATSPFTERDFELAVPQRAVDLRLWVVSGGNANVTGVLIVDDLKITRMADNPSEEGTNVLSDNFEQGIDLDQAEGNFLDWLRGGTKVGIAQVVRAGGNHAMGVIDANPDGFGVWQAINTRLVSVKPGWRFLVQFKEMHSVGRMESTMPVVAQYENLPAGNYRFRVVETSEFGIEQGVETSVPLAVVLPIHKTGWARALMLLFAMGTLTLVVRYATQRKVALQLERLEHQRGVERERTRIARDIHDNLGTNLTQIALLSELARSDLNNSKKTETHLHQIFTSANAMTRALDEVVWAVDPMNDSVEEIIGYICKFAQDFFRLTKIRCRLDVPEDSLPAVISSSERHNLFLVVKEILNNIVKHAQANEVWLRIVLREDALVLSVEDDGRGFPEKPDAPLSTPAMGGHGIPNMKSRMDQINGQFELRSKPGAGTVVKLTLPIKNRGAKLL